MENVVNKSLQHSEELKYRIIIGYSLFILLTSFFFNTPREIVQGMGRIIVSPSLLLSDYMVIGNIGSSTANAGILMLSSIFIAKKNKALMNGPLIAAIFTIGGFAFFGKNIYNVISIVTGVYLHSLIKKEHFTKFLLPAFFGTALSPLVSQVSFGFGFALPLGILLGNILGILIGIILPPLASSFVRFHNGFNLYNIGFTAGITGMLFMSFFRSIELQTPPTSIVYQGGNLVLGSYLLLIFISMIVVKLIISGPNLDKFKKLMTYSGRLVTDFVTLEGFGVTMFNMGLLGIIGLIYVLLVGGEISGPVIGGLFTLIGFGAFGKHPKNIIPIIVGVYIASLLKTWEASSVSGLLAALFGTTLAPISGQYGWKLGILAGFIHMSVVTNIGYLHGGMNLYNNGFSGGFVAAILVPIIESFKKEQEDER